MSLEVIATMQQCNNATIKQNVNNSIGIKEQL